MTPREAIRNAVEVRASHRTTDEVSDTRSFGNMEQTLTREYWGRFLIELLQNARDAWLAAERDGEDGIVRVRLTDEPALLVCNEGVPITPEIVLQSIGKFGESSKSYGAGIGHKGIGFKSVLEVSLTPEIYSRSERGGEFDLRVRFDPDEARRLVLDRSPAWKELVSELVSAGKEDGRGDRIPTLRFPLWVDALPTAASRAAGVDGRAFDTLVRLPYADRFDQRLGLDRAEFVSRARKAMDELTDEIVLFLACFGTALLEDEAAPERTVRIDRVVRERRELASGGAFTAVDILRNGVTASSWWLYERSVDELPGLEGELAVALPMDRLDGLAIPRSPVREASTSSGEHFHLFFPTLIPTHLPFVPHAYFEVDAGRKGFAADSAARNRLLLDALGGLAIDAFRDLSAQADAGSVDLAPLPGLFAEVADDPEDDLAREFRDRFLVELDWEAWVAAGALGSLPARVTAAEVLAEPRGQAAAMLPVALPAPYVHARTGLRYPHPTISRDGLTFLAERAAVARVQDAEGLDGDLLATLLRPGAVPIWDEDHDRGFLTLLHVLDELAALDPVAEDAIEDTRGDSAARFIAVIEPHNPVARTVRAPSSRREGGAPTPARDSVLARLQGSTAPLAPPASLGIDFITDGLLDADLLGSIGTRLGIQQFNTASVLDALATRPGIDDPQAVLAFIWRLLLRESLSSYSVAAAVRRSVTIAPEEWFWARPANATGDVDAERRRLRALGSVRVPTRSREWRPANTVAFGEDWADWIEGGSGAIVGATEARAVAHRDLEALAPDDRALLASPQTLLGSLLYDEADVFWIGGENAPVLPEDARERHIRLMFAFLLRLGVWEALPVEAVVDYRDRSESDRDPWADLPGRSEHQVALAGLDADFERYGHRALHVAEDYRLAWPIGADDATVRALGRAVELIRACRRTVLYCPRCKRHTTRYFTPDEPLHESYLVRQLRTTAWVPVSLGGGPASPVRPDRAWDEHDRPEPGRMVRSWQGFLPLVATDFDAGLGEFIGVRRIDNAEPERIRDLLMDLRERFDADEIEPERRQSSYAGQSITSLHWRLYEQLSKTDPSRAEAIATEVGVLAVKGTRLGYYEPDEVYHDDGEAGILRRHFVGRIPFSILPQDKGKVASDLGIRRLRLQVHRQGDEPGEDMTDQTRAFLHERAAEFLALQVYHPLGGAPLELGSNAFRDRATRLEALRVVQLGNLVLDVSVEGSDVSVVVGADRDADLYLEGARTAKPVLYHDLATDIDDRLRALVPTHLAELLEGHVYSPMFRLLLQQPTDARRLELLDEYGVTEADVERVAERIDRGGAETQQAEIRWWRALLPLLGAKLSGPMTPPDIDGPVRAALDAAGLLGEGSLGEALLAAGGVDDVRRDTDPGGVLARLEGHDVDLRELDSRLRELGDDGLVVDVAARQLGAWLQLHRRLLVAVCLDAGMDAESARNSVSELRAPAAFDLRVRPGASEYLEPVLALLHSIGIEADPNGLADTAADQYLAGLTGTTISGLEQTWTTHFSREERKRVLREHALAWRRALVPVIVAARSIPGVPAHRIRAERNSVESQLPSIVERPAEVTAALPEVLPGQPVLAEELVSLMESWPPLTGPDAGAITEIAREALPTPEHLDRVRAVLQRGSRRRTDAIRKQVDRIRVSGVAPIPLDGIKPPPDRPESVRRKRPKRPKVGPKQRHDQRLLDKLGMDAEHWVRASVLARLLSMEREAYIQAVTSMRDLLESVSDGEIVEGLLRHADEALVEGADEDDRLDALASFIHVAEVSDGFGFDLLGWVSPYPGADERAMLLEVKSSADRHFLVSTWEWERAGDLPDDYAFLIVRRGPDDEPPQGMELLPDPVRLYADGLLPKTADGWKIRYAPADDPKTVEDR